MEIPEGYLPHVDRFLFPYLSTEAEYRFLTVEQKGRQGDDRWAIMDSPHCYNRMTEVWEYEMRPSAREDDWMAQTRMPLVEALPLAKMLCAVKKALALSQISRILVVRVKRAEETGDPRLAEYRQDLAEWRVERKILEEQ